MMLHLPNKAALKGGFVSRSMHYSMSLPAWQAQAA